ncbi:hypothetical protein RRG08_030018 [Elysia crispata]|uniref:Uncharacterized protein n=1 Tax=Elysia crispata TaxID=231223 RepID=A0AAE0XY65_9GAST|nr:hypothetical protein RRG08_030018 [Elysia crispata]
MPGTDPGQGPVTTGCQERTSFHSGHTWSRQRRADPWILDVSAHPEQTVNGSTLDMITPSQAFPIHRDLEYVRLENRDRWWQSRYIVTWNT